MTAPATTTPPRKRGRPPGPSLPPEQRKSAVIRLRTTDRQRATYHRLGGDEWLRAILDLS